jgi:hypothetical protein
MARKKQEKPDESTVDPTEVVRDTEGRAVDKQGNIIKE